MREIHLHDVPGVPELVKVQADDKAVGPGGASCFYVATAEQKAGKVYELKIKFQNGTIAEAGVNGVTNEALLAVVLDRLLCFQRGEFPCRENNDAIANLQAALAALGRRTMDRLDRGVEGEIKP